MISGFSCFALKLKNLPLRFNDCLAKAMTNREPAKSLIKALFLGTEIEAVTRPSESLGPRQRGRASPTCARNVPFIISRILRSSFVLLGPLIDLAWLLYAPVTFVVEFYLVKTPDGPRLGLYFFLAGTGTGYLKILKPGPGPGPGLRR